ncbi:MAG: DUF58 domain-containing protein [Terriglobales bacterium]
MESARPPLHLAWRQSLGAGLLLGLAVGCAWLGHWTPHLYPRLLLFVAAGLLALLGGGLLLTLSDEGGWSFAWQRRLEGTFAGAGMTFFTVLVVLLVAAILTGNNLLYLVVSGLLAALLISGLISALNLSGMELRFRMPEEVFAGRPAPVSFRLTNAKSFWPAYSVTLSASAQPLPSSPAIVAEAALRPLYFSYLARRSGAAAAGDLVFPRRGRYRSATFVLSTRFPFGLLHRRRRFQSSDREPETLVFPSPSTGLELPPALARRGAEEALARRGEGQELYRLRPHQPGDSARSMHWKASARAGSLYVRESSAETGPRLRLRLALPPGLSPARVEALLSVCAGWMQVLDRPEFWLEFVGENATASGGAGLYLRLAPAAQQRRPVLEYLALVDPALAPAPLPGGTPGLFEILVDG